MVLLQENDKANGFANPEWADEVFEAYQELGRALTDLDHAELYS
jgi:hypothetical protein